LQFTVGEEPQDGRIDGRPYARLTADRFDALIAETV